MLDQERWIASQSIMKELVSHCPAFDNLSLEEEWIRKRFSFCLGLMEEYATMDANDEFVNTEISIPKQFWNQDPKAQTEWLTEWGKPMPVFNKVGRKEWFVHTKRRDLERVKKVFETRESDFNDMIQAQEKVKL